MARYRYKPLKERTIRVLRLDYCASSDAPLTGQLEEYPLRAINRNDLIPQPQADYTCFSYVWGSSEKPCTLFLRDSDPVTKSDMFELPITTSLDSLLPRFRNNLYRRALYSRHVVLSHSFLGTSLSLTPIPLLDSRKFVPL